MTERSIHIGNIVEKTSKLGPSPAAAVSSALRLIASFGWAEVGGPEQTVELGPSEGSVTQQRLVQCSCIEKGSASHFSIWRIASISLP